MSYLVAVSSKDGKMVHQHFGHTETFQILRVEKNEQYEFAEQRSVVAPCSRGTHEDGQLEQVVQKLADCKYVLSAKIGLGAQEALKASGITPLEIAHFIDYAMGKVMQYDKKYNP